MSPSKNALSNFLLQQCFNDLINTAPRAAGAPLISGLPWEGYEVQDALTGDVDMFANPKVLLGSYGGSQMSIGSLRLDVKENTFDWYKNAQKSPCVVRALNTLTPQACETIGQEVLAAQKKFLERLWSGGWDREPLMQEWKQESVLTWMRAFADFFSKPTDWLLTLPHREGFEAYLEGTLGQIENVAAFEGEGASVKDRTQYLLQEGKMGLLGVGAVVGSCATYIAKQNPRHDALLKNEHNCHRLIEKITQLQERIWLKQEHANQGALKVMEPAIRVAESLIQDKAFSLREKSVREYDFWGSFVGPQEEHGIRNLALFCMKKSATLERRLKKKEILESEKKVLLQEQEQWTHRALRLVSMLVHVLEPHGVLPARVFEECASYLPHACGRRTPSAILSEQVVHLGRFFGEQERYGFSPLGHLPRALLKNVPLPMIFGMLSETQAQSGQYACLHAFVMEECFDEKGVWKEKKGAPLPPELKELFLVEPLSFENKWQLTRTQWMQLMAALALQKGDEKTLKSYLKSEHLKDQTLISCCTVMQQLVRQSPFSMLDYDIERPKFAWLKKMCLDEGIEEEGLKAFLRKSEGFSQMLERWCADLSAKELKRTLSAEGKKVRKTKGSQKRL